MTALATLQPLDVPLQGVQLIEASAGTGKTWTIAALYLRLVLGHGRAGPALLPPQILVLTFTKAATAELRERIRARLAEAAEVFRGQRTPDDYLTRLMAHYPADDARALAARQLELAAQWMDEAAVFTIHGWCQRMLGQHAFDSGHPLVQEVNSDESALLAEAVRDYWRQHCFVLEREHSARISALWANPTQLQAAVAPLLRQPLEQLRVGGELLPQIDDLASMLSGHYASLADAERAARRDWSEHAGTPATMRGAGRPALAAAALIVGTTYSATARSSAIHRIVPSARVAASSNIRGPSAAISTGIGIGSAMSIGLCTLKEGFSISARPGPTNTALST